MNFRSFATAREAATALAEQVMASLRQTLDLHGSASLSVPGGRTPVPLFEALRRADLRWGDVGVTLTDERWVPAEHPASNAALVRKHLLQDQAAAARFVPLFNAAATAAAGASSAWQSLQAMPRPFAAVVLGMGEDGHFASLFPGNGALAGALDPAAVPACVAMQAPVAPEERLSLNLAALAMSRRLFLLVSGEPKRALLQRASVSVDASLPVSALLALRDPAPEVYWSP